MIVYAVIDDLSPGFPLGGAVETFARREEAERFIDDVRSDDPEIAAKLTPMSAEPGAQPPAATAGRGHETPVPPRPQ